MDVFMDMYLWIWVSGFVLWMVFFVLWTCMGMCLDLYGHRVSILREAGFNKYRGLPLLGARFHHYWDLLLDEAHFSKSWVLLLHEAHLDGFSNFSHFPLTKMEKFAPIWSVE
jgi:hypothetical protein